LHIKNCTLTYTPPIQVIFSFKKMKYCLTLLAFSLFASLATAQTTLSKTMTFGGIARTYRLYIPASYQAGTAAPLVFNLHGYTSNNQQQEFYGDFRTIADTAGFIIVHPNGTADASGNLFWNAGFSATGPDDLGFLLALADSLSATYNINQNRIYTTGMSNGGIMSYYLSCHSNRFAAMASVTGTMTIPNYSSCVPSKPTPVMEIHGTADATVPYIGSTTFMPIDSVVRYWVRYNGCTPTPVTTNVANTNLTDGATAIRTVYGGGRNGVTVEHYKVIGGAHTWPGAGITIGVTCQDFKASKEIWRFFNQYRLTATESRTADAPQFTIAPNRVYNTLNFSTLDFVSATAEVLDITGKVLLSQNFNSNSDTINVAHLPQGCYFLRIKTAKGEFRGKFVKGDF
jgi:polyhydroxybutyrate depolymerase